MRIFLEKLKDNFFAERSRWFPWVSVLFALGIGIYFSLGFEPSIWVGLIGIEIVIIAAFLCRFYENKLLAAAVFSIVVLGFATALLKANYIYEDYPENLNEKIYVKGYVVDLDYNYRGMPRLVLDNVRTFDEDDIKGKIRVVLNQKKTDLKIGDCVEMITELKPRLNPSMVGGYQFSRKMFFQGVNVSGFVISRAIPVDCEIRAPIKNKISSMIFGLRESVVKKIDAVLPKDQAGIASAILAGQRGSIGENLYNQYRDSGLAHFLSISGLHMSMIAGLMFFLVRLVMVMIPPLAMRYDSKKTAAVFAIGISFLYLLISGAEVPAKRAFIMMFIVLIGILHSRTAVSMITISWAALVVLVISPDALTGPSFQMSFAAVVCLIAFYERFAGKINGFLNGSNRTQSSLFKKIIKIMLVYIIGILIADLIASLATLPFAIYHFNRIALFTTLGNLLAGPVIGLIIMPFVLAALLLMPFGMEYYPLKVVGWGIEIVNEITFFVSHLPYAGYQIISMPMWGLLMIVLSGLWLCVWNLPWRKWGWVGIVIGILSIFTTSIPDFMINGDGDLFAVKTNENKLVILPSRGNGFDKKMWLEKSASAKLTNKEYKLLKEIYEGKKTDKAWLDLSCDESNCIYKGLIVINKSGGADIGGKSFDTLESQGASIYIKNGEVIINTVRDYVGKRLWSK